MPTTSEPVWVGAPLRVHRRCEQPMFDMSNTLAYGKMMVYGTREEQFPARPRDAYPDSCWIDVKRRDGTGKWVPAQGKRCYECCGSCAMTGSGSAWTRCTC